MQTATIHTLPVSKAMTDSQDLRITLAARPQADRFNTKITSVPEAQLPAQATQLSELTGNNRQVVAARLLIVEWVLKQEVSENRAVDLLLAEARAQVSAGTSTHWLPLRLFVALKTASKKDQLIPSDSTIKRWITEYRRSNGNPVALADKHTGKRRKPQPWDLRALQMYHTPGKPGYGDVADWLTMEGYTVTGAQVRRFIKSMPGNLRAMSKWRVGLHTHAQDLGRHKTRDRASLHVGEMYEGDGHRIDVYLQHPSGSPRPFRLEITAWMDLRSRKIMGIGISMNESALSTLESLSRAILNHDHVPTFVHVDHGSGFINQAMSGPGVGYYDRMGISVEKSIAGNAKGKGDIEGWFGWLRNKCDKQFGVDYTGDDQAREANRRITEQVKRDLRQLPRVEEYVDKLFEVTEFYNNRSQKGLDGMSPNQVWDRDIEKYRNPVILREDAALHLSKQCAIRRGRINLDNRCYEHPLLHPYSNEKGVKYRVNYSTDDDSKVWVYDHSDRLICEAPLLTKIAHLPDSRREEGRIKAEKAVQKRRQTQEELDRLEATRHIDHTHQLAALEEMGVGDWEEFEEPSTNISISLTDDDF